MGKKISNSKKGFTLLEVVVSIAILMIILIPILSMVYSTVKTNQMAEDRQTAQALMQKYIEAAKANPVAASQTYTEGDFKVYVTVTSLPAYDFPVDTNTPQSANNLSYAATITMDAQNQSLNIYDNNGNNVSSIPVTSAQVITIVDNGSGLGLVQGYNTDDTLDKIIPITSLGTNVGDINIRVQSSLSYKLSIHVKNYCDGNVLNFYCSEADNSNNNIFIINNLGNVSSLYNIPMQNTSSNTSTSRVYQITTKVYKAGNLITSSTAYKSALD
jgi:prepilin-type N-terminal cleavage/methylation domain-containing protein